jgi:biopolymer transport protein ExbD
MSGDAVMVVIARQRRARLGIDMSPLIDCVFQLLIFFMLSSNLLTPMIQLTLPQAATADETEPDEIIVAVDGNGSFYLNDRRIRVEELQAELQPLVLRSRHKVVTFRGDQKMPFELFIRAVDAARASGAVHINIAHRLGEP